MKIALLSEKYTPDIGGLAISTDRLARLLSSAGHAVRVFCPSLNLPPSKKRTLVSGNVRVTRFGAHKRVDDTFVDWFELIVEEHKRERFDVLHGYFLTQAGFITAYAGKYLNVPSVVSIRGNDIERTTFDPARFSHTMYALQEASAVTTNAHELAKKAGAFVGREIFFIPNGIDTGHFKPMERNNGLADALGLRPHITLNAAWGALHARPGSHLHLRQVDASPPPKTQTDMAPVIGFVGELREKKGLKTLLSAYARVNEEHAATLLVVGEVRPGEDKKTFDEFRMANPGAKVIVTGYVPPVDLPAYYSLIDVFVHPSLRDGMPNAVLEAMACEKAVVATPVGGVAEVIKDGENGSFVPVKDAESLSKTITRLLNDKSLRCRLGKSARETIRKEFTLQKELDANLDVYRALEIKDNQQ